MKKLHKVLVLITILLTITSVTAFASSSYNSPAEVAAGLTGKSLESITAQRSESEKTYGAIANEAGKLTEFKAEMLEMKKDALDEKVADGTITQDKAAEILTAIEKNQSDCDGSEPKRIGNKFRAGFGNMMGNGQGKGGFRQSTSQ